MVDMAPRPFDAMLTRDQAPWPRRDTGRSWGEFSTVDAYRVALMHALVRQGQGYSEAGSAIRADFDDLIEVNSEEPGDLLFGWFITETERSEEDGVRLRLTVAAPETKWFAELARVKNIAAKEDSLIAFTAINATAVMRRTLTLARLANLVDDRLLELAAKVRAV